MQRGTVLRVRRAPTLLIAVVLVAGCGGSSSSNQRLTREEYAAQADAICKKYKQKTDTLTQPRTLADLVEVADRVLPILDHARSDLRKLRPPQNEQATAQAWLDEFDVSIDDVKKIRDVAKTNDRAAVQAAALPALRHDKHANDLATQLGMSICNQS